jgi:hypothetical protein
MTDPKFRELLIAHAITGAALDPKAVPDDVATRAIAVADAVISAVDATAKPRTDRGPIVGSVHTTDPENRF